MIANKWRRKLVDVVFVLLFGMEALWVLSRIDVSSEWHPQSRTLVKKTDTGYIVMTLLVIFCCYMMLASLMGNYNLSARCFIFLTVIGIGLMMCWFF